MPEDRVETMFVGEGRAVVLVPTYPLTPEEIEFGDRRAVAQGAIKALDTGQVPNVEAAKALVSWMVADIAKEPVEIPFADRFGRQQGPRVDLPQLYPRNEDYPEEYIPKGVSKTFPNGLTEWGDDGNEVAEIITFETLKRLPVKHHEVVLDYLFARLDQVQSHELLHLSHRIGAFIDQSPRREALTHQLVEYVWQHRDSYDYMMPLEHGYSDALVNQLMQFGLVHNTRVENNFLGYIASLDDIHKTAKLLGIFADSMSYPDALSRIRHLADESVSESPARARMERLGRMLLGLAPGDTSKPFHTSIQSLYKSLDLRQHRPNIEAQALEVSLIKEILGHPTQIEDTAVDLACGQGRISNALAAAGYKNIVGVDISPDELAQARADDLTTMVSYREADWSHTGLPDAQARLVVCLGRSLHNAKNRDELFRVYREVHRVLKPGGTFLFDAADPNLGRYRENKLHYIQALQQLGVPFDRYSSEADLLARTDYVVSTPDGENFNYRLVLQDPVVQHMVRAAGFDVEVVQRAEITGWEGSENIYYRATKK